MRLISGISEVAANYDVILLDQFGVIHDGQKVYKAAVDAVSKLHEAGLKIVILSNSSREASHALEKINSMGVPQEHIYGVVTSGELALAEVSEYMRLNPKSRALHFNWKTRSGVVGLEKHGIRHVSGFTREKNGIRLPGIADFDFILAHGTEGFSVANGDVISVPLEELRALCREVGERRPDVKFFCANPDLVTVDGPELRIMPGTLAADFEEMGGKAIRLGKPGLIAYEAARKLAAGRMLAVGDSVGHDLLGAVRAGVDCLYIAGGINAGRFGIGAREGLDGGSGFTWDNNVVEDIISEEAPELGDARPAYVCDFLRW